MNEKHEDESVTVLLKDNWRLRDLIKRVEWEGKTDVYCPWCHVFFERPHGDDCPAFTSAGEVR